MKKKNMLSVYRQRNPYKGIPNVTCEHKTYDNLVDSNFDSPYAYNVLCTYITYLICKGMRAYMSVIKNASTGKIVAYEISESLKIDCVLNTVKQLDKELLNDEAMIHSDQESHYTSSQFSNLLNKYQIALI